VKETLLGDEAWISDIFFHLKLILNKKAACQVNKALTDNLPNSSN